MASSTFQVPESILIIGSGVFGLSTALSFASRADYKDSNITVLDRSPFPSPDGSSIDASRIVRADYSDPAYSALASAAQTEWRKQGPNDLGGEGRYSETGLVLVANNEMQGLSYVQKSFRNVKKEWTDAGDPDGVKELLSSKEIHDAVGTGGGSGEWGYVNYRSGWADAEASMIWLRKRAEATGRIKFVTAEVTELIFSTSESTPASHTVAGAKLKDGTTILASLTILATGAWTPKLIDLRGRCHSTGQCLAYLPITDSEQAALSKMPVLLNMSTGLFVIPPRNNMLKIARHAYGYSNPSQIPYPEPSPPTNPAPESITVSLPRTSWNDPSPRIPLEGLTECAAALSSMVPSLANRPFTSSRLCWYTDTPNGDFLIDYHPSYGKTLFLATGGSGHGFKFLPVIGDAIVECVEGRCPEAFREKWKWPTEKVDVVVTEDGSRGGRPGLLLDEELAKG